MTGRGRLWLLLVVMATVEVVTVGVTAVSLYHVALRETGERLSDIVDHKIAEIESLERELGSHERVLQVQAEIQRRFKGFLASGELMIGRREGDRILFLLEPRYNGLDAARSVPFESRAAEPMRRALKGLRGTVVGPDYRGRQVVAAYAPLPHLGWAIAAKIDMNEFRADFAEATLLSLGLAALAALVGAWFFVRLFRPMLTALENSEHRFRALFDSTLRICALVTRDGRVVELNRTGEAFSGHDRCEALGKPLWDARPWSEVPEARERLEELVSRAAAGEVARCELTTATARSPRATVDLVIRPLEETSVLSQFLMLEGADISDRKKAEGELLRVNRALRTLSGCNHALLRAQDEQELLKEACRIIHTVGGYVFTWVGYAQSDEIKSVRPVAWYGNANDYLTSARISWSETDERGQGPVGKTIRSGRAHVLQDLMTDPAFAPWRNLAQAHGYASAMYLPLQGEEGMIGTLAIFADVREAFQEEEQRLLQELADDLAFGIATLRIRERHARAEVALKQTEEKLRAFFESDVLGTCLGDTYGNVTEANDAFLRMMGLTRDDLRDGPVQWKELTAPESVPVDEMHIAEAKERGACTPYEKQFIRKDGRRVHTLIGYVLLGEQRDEVVAFLLDLTERKRDEARLHESQERFRMAFEHAAIGMCLTRTNGGLVRVNRAFCEMMGYTEEELYGRHYRFLAHPEDRDAGVDGIRRMLAGEVPSSAVRMRCVHKSGRSVWVDITSALIKDSAGKALGFITLVQDISEQKRAEEELLRTESLLSGVLNSSLSGVVAARAVRDGSGRIQDFECLLANKTVERITGRPASELVGMRMREAIRGTDREHFFARCVKIVETGQPVDEEYVVTLEGRQRWFRSSAVKLGDGFAATLSDITESKHLQEELLQSQKMEAVGQLAGGVAHDFNNLLTVILGTSEAMLEECTPNEPIAADVLMVQRAAQRAAALTRQLLAFSRRQVMHPEILCLNETVKEAEKMLARLLGEDVHLVFTPGSDLCPIKADPGQMTQIVMNLAVNARDAMPNGGRLSIQTSNVILDEQSAGHVNLPPGPYVCLTVSDTGIGMSRETAARIFEPFFTTKAPGKGTGLGLATVYGIAQQSGGTITVSSEEGYGTAFHVYLPAALEETNFEAEADDPPVPQQHGTVLLVEDDELVRELSARVLRSGGYTVIEAEGGEQALRKVGEFSGKIHALVTDVVMPGMSGPELAEKLKVVRPQTRVVFMSGYADRTADTRGLLNRDMHFIQKPFTREILLQTLQEVLDEPL